MSYKDLLVYVDDSASNDKRVEAAITLAKQNDAHLIGLYVVEQFQIPTYAEFPIGQEMVDAAQNAFISQANKARRHFEAATDAAGLSYEWRALQKNVVTALLEHARYADLIILGQTDTNDPNDQSDGLADHTVLATGRPSLVIPYIGAQRPMGRHIVVSWNGSREATRAVNDALPLLKGAEKVEVVSVNPEDNRAGSEGIPCTDLCLHLARHGVICEAVAYTAKDIDVGDLLLSRVADTGADTIVMGAYGRSRFREMVLGGATRHLLEHMTVPVFMSH